MALDSATFWASSAFCIRRRTFPWGLGAKALAAAARSLPLSTACEVVALCLRTGVDEAAAEVDGAAAEVDCLGLLPGGVTGTKCRGGGEAPTSAGSSFL